MGPSFLEQAGTDSKDKLKKEEISQSSQAYPSN
jgi:hypothetical protein